VHNGKGPFHQAFGAIKVECSVGGRADLEDEVSRGDGRLVECCVLAQQSSVDKYGFDVPVLDAATAANDTPDTADKPDISLQPDHRAVPTLRAALRRPESVIRIWPVRRKC
jgi:hypothetical protein